MANIDYIKNVQIMGLLENTNELTYNASSLPVSGPPDECIIKQINIFDPREGMEIYTIWTDICNDYVATILCNNSLGVSEPSTRIKITRPLSGNITFKIFETSDNKYVAPGEIIQVVLNLEFVRYKK